MGGSENDPCIIILAQMYATLIRLRCSFLDKENISKSTTCHGVGSGHVHYQFECKILLSLYADIMVIVNPFQVGPKFWLISLQCHPFWLRPVILVVGLIGGFGCSVHLLGGR